MRDGGVARTGGQGSLHLGVVSGFVLKLARQSAGLTQERLAAVLAVDVSTVQGWESGRRPLSSVSTGGFLHLGARLAQLGAPPGTGHLLREAVEADLVLSAGIDAADRSVSPEAHPLAARVHRRALTNLILWPLTGVTPSSVVAFGGGGPRPGPQPRHPVLPVGGVARFLDHLFTIAERANDPRHAVLRRQAVYLLGFDRRPHVVEWLRDDWQRAARGSGADGDVRALMVARSASVALASAGDRTRLDDFVAANTGDAAQTMNLNYWAHWIGETPEDRIDDEFLRRDNPASWSGSGLLADLIRRVEPSSPHLSLNLHTMHGLVAARPLSLVGRGNLRAALAQALERIASTDVLTRVGRGQVDDLRYALRMADR